MLEAKRESLHPLVAKEQARKYAKTVEARFVILSNGIVHYLWDTTKGNPKPIYKFPSPDEIGAIKDWHPDRQTLADEPLDADYIVAVQMSDYARRPGWTGSVENSQDFIWANGLKFLRPYQFEALQALQKAVGAGKDRFLFEMATGTGKTLTSAAVIRLFLRSENARRVLFLVDRLELEDQAWKAFTNYLKPDYSTFIYNEHKTDWRQADIVVTTIQSLMVNDRYRYGFNPTDFDLLISDEAHRSISGNARAVFEYFHGYKLGLTATPKDYLKGVDADQVRADDPREIERRMLRDTYSTFGCEGGDPTFRYSLLDGVKDGYLINPWVLDARTEITDAAAVGRGLRRHAHHTRTARRRKPSCRGISRRSFFPIKPTTFSARRSYKMPCVIPITGEVGKTILFAVSQNHARRLSETLNELADALFPGKYASDFAVQVTSQVSDAQQMTINFSNNNLNGKTPWLDGYASAKTRVCVTVGMMTTGYDCTDLLNIGMMRPIFSPADFVQIKGRGTRRHTFEYKFKNQLGEEETVRHEKEAFKLFDFLCQLRVLRGALRLATKNCTLPKPPKGDGLGGGGWPRGHRQVHEFPGPTHWRPCTSSESATRA